MNTQVLDRIKFALLILLLLCGFVAWLRVFWPFGVAYFIAMLVAFDNREDSLIYGD